MSLGELLARKADKRMADEHSEAERDRGKRGRTNGAAWIGAGAVILAALIGGAATLASRSGGPSQTPPPAHSQQLTYQETTGGVAHTWTDYTTGGGAQGPTIGAHATVRVSCKVTGLSVPNDNDPWWYRLSSAPWSGKFYVSADAFYNNGHVRGSLLGTPHVDKSVRTCK